MRALITGAAGFIGSHLADELLAAGDTVTGLDDLSTGCEANLGKTALNPKFRFVLGDVTDSALVGQLVREADVVYHLAAVVGTFAVRYSPLRCLEVNLQGTRNVAEAAAWHAVRVVFASTSEVYGSQSGPLAENAHLHLGSPLRPRWAYALSKAADEALLAAYGRERQLRAVIVRPFNISGPRQSPSYGMVIPRFVRQALGGMPLTVHGDGSMRRAFCHIADVTPPLRRMALMQLTGFRALNVGGTSPVTISELARRVIELTGSSSSVQHIPLGEAMGEDWDDIARGLPDISAAQAAGFRPHRTLDSIIRDVAGWIRDEA